MFESIGSFFSRDGAGKGDPIDTTPGGFHRASPQVKGPANRSQSFSKVFRWRLPPGEPEPGSVHVVGSFSNWQKVPLERDRGLDAWHVRLDNLQGNRTHHYMLLLDGKPAYDHTCDGLAVPHGPHEEKFQLMTEKGPRVFMLFAQTK